VEESENCAVEAVVGDLISDCCAGVIAKDGGDSVNKEKLLELGLDEEAAGDVLKMFMREIRGYVPKSRFDCVNDANKLLKAEVVKLSEDNEVKANYEERLKTLCTRHALERELSGKVFDFSLVASLIDVGKVEVLEDGEVVSGVFEQVEALRCEKPFLFVDETSFEFDGIVPDESAGERDLGSDVKEIMDVFSAAR